jgi:Domain of unknown function (DUF4412)
MRNFAALSSVITLGLLVCARADLTIVQQVEGQGQNGDVTVKIKGDKERMDAPSQPTRIIDGKTGEMTDLMNDQKKFVRISAEQMKAAAETIGKFSDERKPATSKLTPTGKTEKINGYDTEEFVYETPKFKASFWVATKYPDAAGILKQMQAPITGAWKPSNLGMPDYTDFAGLPLKTVISVGNNQVVTTIVSIKADTLSASDFEIPKDFQEVKPPIETAPPPTESPMTSPSATP